MWNKSIYDLSLEAAKEAINNSRLTTHEIEAVYVANMLSSKIDNQDHLGAQVSSQLGINVPALRVEGACASGGLAVHLACLALQSGLYKNVLVLGVEKMTDVPALDITTYLMGAGSVQERKSGLTFPGLYALMARAHMQKYGTKREHLAAVAIKNHYHASFNEKAQFPKEISLEQILASPLICDPFTIFDASPISDGAAAVVLSSKTLAKGVNITASETATDNIDLSSRESLTELKATKIASQKAFQQAGIEVSDINVLEVHDCFTIAEIMAMEDLGICQKGEGGRYIESGITKLGGKMPVNTSGGLKACGHPVGATGVKQIVEITDQLMGRAGPRQVKGAKVGLTQNVGGTGATVVVHVLQK